ncbi:MAG: S49 family peptidase, partial [Planctomycetales bacterium]|nr:S49 family peptidase [Planctomycetales bacterium]
QALVTLAKKKPTVVSMGEMAASGGYWISCIDTPVYAERGTITGSIGVFSMKLSFGSLMRRIGVHVESITLDDSAALFAIDHAWTDEEIKSFQATIDHVYSRFLNLVAENRGMKAEQVNDLGGGRVWSGTQAKANGLVDSIGGLDDCLAVVAKQAELDDYKVIHRPEASTGLNLAELLGQNDEDEILWRVMPKNAFALLERQGFAMSTTLTLLRDALASPHRQPTVWLLGPAEISIH